MQLLQNNIGAKNKRQEDKNIFNLLHYNLLIPLPLFHYSPLLSFCRGPRDRYYIFTTFLFVHFCHWPLPHRYSSIKHSTPLFHFVLLLFIYTHTQFTSTSLLQPSHLHTHYPIRLNLTSRIKQWCPINCYSQTLTKRTLFLHLRVFSISSLISLSQNKTLLTSPQAHNINPQANKRK